MLVVGQVVEHLVPEPRTFENADFLFSTVPLVAELKEIETEFDRSAAFREGFRALIGRVMKEDPNWRPLLVGGSGEYPKWFSQELIRLFRPPVSRVLKEANRQLRDTKAHFNIAAPTGLLLFVNDGFTALEPHFVRALACDILVNSYPTITSSKGTARSVRGALAENQHSCQVVSESWSARAGLRAHLQAP